MRIVFITEYFTRGMGYLENCLPKALASLGHEVHVCASNLNVGGNWPDYRKIYEAFLGPAEQACGTFPVDGYTLHRLPHRTLGRYVRIEGLVSKVFELSPDVVQLTSAAGINTFRMALACVAKKLAVFSACHQCSSVIHPYLNNRFPLSPQRLVYFATRTLPGWLASQVTEKCYAATPDCAEVAHRLYGVPQKKIAVMPLGTDTSLFHPADCAEDLAARNARRSGLGFGEADVVCIYTGRLAPGKNPLLLAQAVARLREAGRPFRGWFVGDGPQKAEIEKQPGCLVAPFVSHDELPHYYRAADVGAWPFQESMSMLDAAACGLPVVANDRLGERNRAEGNGLFYRQGDGEDLVRTLRRLESPDLRKTLGAAGVLKMREQYSWNRIAAKRSEDYAVALSRMGKRPAHQCPAPAEIGFRNTG